MLHGFTQAYAYNKVIISNWNNPPIGVYYCGTLAQNGGVFPYYIGRAIGEGGIRDRLLQHIQQDRWPGVTHFVYRACDTSTEAIQLELVEIQKYKPRHNTQGI